MVINNNTHNASTYSADTTLVTKLGRVAVLMGGTSAEREISLQSGQAILDALVQQGVNAIGVDIGSDPMTQLQALEIDRVFIALHGPGGEDGKIQALLEYMSLPYTGSSVMTCAVTMDKLRTKNIWQGRDLPTPKFALIEKGQVPDDIYERLGQKMIVKPCHEGSSIGMAIVTSEHELQKAAADASRYDDLVLVEQFIEGNEYTVAILNGCALPAIELITKRGFYDFHAKYIDDDTQYLCPCGLDDEKLKQISDLALKAFQSVGGEGWGRVDVMADKQGDFYLLEVNTVPGMTSHSLVPMAANAVGISFSELVVTICTQTLDEGYS